MKFTNTVIEEIVQAHYELTVKATSLVGYDELNFILTESVDKKYILKLLESNMIKIL